ncbi:exodeoxyribonuclease VII large subunit [Streptomyces sp. N2-109]|uniref:Exodeoxyribonuclease 7 large subunit n=1 Tax=Streptomyces gossypii TaxID=2883101 RepID=A0ABT2JVM5_9ACTN|nr:exodeoxyribonuclease VII large subunit [Streptomyces gossypii]MCT2591958.1 exodeoxyribonuclease VII large subunit [Streptomyces gossypii]
MALHTTAEAPIPVGKVSQLIGEWINRLGTVWTEGQITQLNRRSAKSWVYLTLRDPSQEISIDVVCPPDVFAAVADVVTQGARVVVCAKPSWYAPRGSLSLRAREIRPVGVGELLVRLERLKRALEAEGLFDAARKRPLPFLPRCVGLVTGRASDAERDVLRNATLRWPAVRFEVRQVAVQGVQAVPQVTGAVRELDEHPDVDLIIVARGGGSLEDLLPFSDEGLVRAVAACRTPVVSAIGHERDAPLLDHVADLRASTPTDAAKRTVPDVGEEYERVRALRERSWRVMTGLLEREKRALREVRSRPALADPHRAITDRQADVDFLAGRARRTFGHRLDRAEDDLVHTRARVLALSPAATLERGYAVLQRADGAVIRKPSDAEPGRRLRARVAEGEFGVTVDGPVDGPAEGAAKGAAEE